jgi:hypothetical protein
LRRFAAREGRACSPSREAQAMAQPLLTTPRRTLRGVAKLRIGGETLGRNIATILRERAPPFVAVTTLRQGVSNPATRRDDDLTRRHQGPTRRREDFSRRLEESSPHGEKPPRRSDNPSKRSGFLARGRVQNRRDGETGLRGGDEEPRDGERAPRDGERGPREGAKGTSRRRVGTSRRRVGSPVLVPPSTARAGSALHPRCRSRTNRASRSA